MTRTIKMKSWHTYCQFGAEFEAACRRAVIAAAIVTYLQGR